MSFFSQGHNNTNWKHLFHHTKIFSVPPSITKSYHNMSFFYQDHLRALHQAQIEMLDGQVISLRFAWQQNCSHLPGYLWVFYSVNTSFHLLPSGGTCQSARRSARRWSCVWGKRRNRLQMHWGPTEVHMWQDCVWSVHSTRPFWRGRTLICMPRLLRGSKSKAPHNPELLNKEFFICVFIQQEKNKTI